MADAQARPLAGRTAVVTGATHGIGTAIARGLAQQGADLVLVVRDAVRAKELQASISAESGVKVDLVLADLSAQADVRHAARDIVKRFPAVHIVVSNAGILNVRRVLTVDSVEETLAVNHLAPWLLITKLLPLLKKTAAACPEGRGVRIVMVGSDAQRFAKRFNFDDPNLEKGYSAFAAYSQSKLANCMFTFTLADRLRSQGVSNLSVTCVHPGAVATNIANNNGFLVAPLKAMLGYFMRTPEQGAAGALYLASAPEAEGLTGKYFTDRVGQPPAEAAPPACALDEAAWARLWTLSDAITQPRQEPVLISPPSSPSGAACNVSPLAPGSPLAPASPSAEAKAEADAAVAKAKAEADAAAAKAKADADAAAAKAKADADAKAKADADAAAAAAAAAAAKAKAEADAAAAKKAAEERAAAEAKKAAEAEAAAAAKKKAEEEAAAAKKAAEAEAAAAKKKADDDAAAAAAAKAAEEAAAAAAKEAAAAKVAEEAAAAAKKAEEEKAAAEAAAAAKEAAAVAEPVATAEEPAAAEPAAPEAAAPPAAEEE